MKPFWRRADPAVPADPASFVRIEDAYGELARIAERDHAARQVDIVDARLDHVLERYRVSGPVCHVGSKAWSGDEEDVRALRKLLGQGGEVVGLDLEAGLNVDVVADVCDPELFTKHPELRARFRFVYVSALLEHVEDPFAGARNVAGLLAEGGLLYSAHPWVWGFHPYPNDLWRFSIRAIRRLFPGIEWLEWWYSGVNPQVGLRILGGDPSIERKLFLSLRREPTLGGMLSDRWLPYLNVVAIGRRGKFDAAPAATNGTMRAS